MSVLIIIPARGGSKGIPRKNLRPLHGKPLISYAISLTKQLPFANDAFVSSDDDEIITVANKLGMDVIHRNPELAKDATTLDPVIFDAYQQASSKASYDLVITLQPTSPLLKPETLTKAVQLMKNNPEIDTLISVEDNTHLSWREVDGKILPNYEKRLNRQQLPKVYRETGGFFITRSKFVRPDSRLGKNVQVFPVAKPESIDIDSYEDFQLCEYFLRRKKILIVTNGNTKIGLGHVYNTLSLANELVDQELLFLVHRDGELAASKIKQLNYPVVMQSGKNILHDIMQISPDVVINDFLDTTKEYVQDLKRNGYKVINFEDLGSGARHADLVFNAIYPERDKLPNHYFGHAYFILRDEFYLTPEKSISKNIKSVLITFGGTDSNNFTCKVLSAIYPYCEERGIEIHIVAGLGYTRYETLTKFKNITIHRNVKNISDYMVHADLVFTSAGRTTFEVASLGVPAVVMAQNAREATHLFASGKYGFKYLGLGKKVSESRIRTTFKNLCESVVTRRKMSATMLACKIKQGKHTTVKMIRNLIND